MFGIGMTELLVIFVLGLLVLGPKRLPELARSLGRSLAEFRRASNEMRREFMDVADEVRIEPPSLEPTSEPGEPKPPDAEPAEHAKSADPANPAEPANPSPADAEGDASTGPSAEPSRDG